MKTIITSIVTTVLTFWVLSWPPILFIYLWLALGYFSAKLFHWYETKEYPMLEHGFLYWFILIGPISLLVTGGDIWSQIKKNFKFQSPIVKNEE